MNERIGLQSRISSCFKPKAAMILMLILLVAAVLPATGCQRIEAAMEEKNKKTQNREIMAKRYVEIGDYVEAYLEEKYNEDFQNGGIYETSIPDVDSEFPASVTYNFKSNYTGVSLRPSYWGKYAHPEMDVTIENGTVDDGRYYSWRRGYEFRHHQQERIDELFPGTKTKYYVTFDMDGLYENELYDEPDIIDPKYFDIDYILDNERDKLDDYYLNIDYFRNVYPENKDEMLSDIFDFLVYTRSLGFKHCKLDMWIFEKSVLETDAYKEYVNEKKSMELSLYLGGKDIRRLSVYLEPDEFDKVQSVDDLKSMKVFKELIGDYATEW